MHLFAVIVTGLSVCKHFVVYMQYKDIDDMVNNITFETLLVFYFSLVSMLNIILHSRVVGQYNP